MECEDAEQCPIDFLVKVNGRCRMSASSCRNCVACSQEYYCTEEHPPYRLAGDSRGPSYVVFLANRGRLYRGTSCSLQCVATGACYAR